MKVEKRSYSAVQKWRRKKKRSTITELHTPELHTVLQEASSGHSKHCHCPERGFYAHGLP